MSPSSPALPAVKPQQSMSALDLLRNDHRQILELLSLYLKGRESLEVSKKTTLAGRICKALAVHTAIEEEIFNPAIRETVEGSTFLLDVVEVENSMIRHLANEVSSSTPSTDPRFDAKISVLDQFFREHVRLKEEKLFPTIRKTSLELAALGEQLALRRRDALAAIGSTEMQAK